MANICSDLIHQLIDMKIEFGNRYGIVNAFARPPPSTYKAVASSEVSLKR